MEDKEMENKNKDLTLDIEVSDVFVVQNSKKRAYIEQFKQKGINYTQKKLGTFLGFFIVRDSSINSANIVNFLTAEIKKEYFAFPKRGIAESFETSLHRVNRALEEVANVGNVDWLGTIDGAICAIDEENMYFSITGEAAVLLIRDNQLMNISEGLTSLEAKKHPLKTFVDISSGQLMAGDKIIITSPELLSLVSFDELKRNALRLSRGNFVQFVNTVFSNECKMAAAFIVDVNKKLDSLNENINDVDDEEEIHIPNNVFTADVFSKDKQNSLIANTKDEESLNDYNEEKNKDDEIINNGEYTDKRTGHIYLQGDNNVENVNETWSSIADILKDTTREIKEGTRKKFRKLTKKLAKSSEDTHEDGYYNKNSSEIENEINQLKNEINQESDLELSREQILENKKLYNEDKKDICEQGDLLTNNIIKDNLQISSKENFVSDETENGSTEKVSDNIFDNYNSNNHFNDDYDKIYFRKDSNNQFPENDSIVAKDLNKNDLYKEENLKIHNYINSEETDENLDKIYVTDGESSLEKNSENYSESVQLENAKINSIASEDNYLQEKINNSAEIKDDSKVGNNLEYKTVKSEKYSSENKIFSIKVREDKDEKNDSENKVENTYNHENIENENLVKTENILVSDIEENKVKNIENNSNHLKNEIEKSEDNHLEKFVRKSNYFTKNENSLQNESNKRNELIDYFNNDENNSDTFKNDYRYYDNYEQFEQDDQNLFGKINKFFKGIFVFEKIREINKKKKNIILSVFLIIIISSIIFFYEKNKNSDNITEQSSDNQSVTVVNQAQNNNQTSSTANTNTNNNQSTDNSNTNSVSSNQTQVEQQTNKPEIKSTIADPENVYNDTNFLGVKTANKKYFLITKNQIVDLENKSKYVLDSNFGNVKYSTAVDVSILLITDKNKLIYFNLNNKKFEEKKIGDTDEIKDIKLLDTFGKNVYVLSDSGINKYSQNNTGLVNGTKWLKTDYSTKSIKDMSINGSIFLVKNNKLEVLYSGNKKTFDLENNPKIDLVFAEDTDNIWTLNKEKGTINSFDLESGDLKNSFTHKDIVDAIDFTVDEKNKTALIITGDKVLKFKLENK